MAGTTKRTVLSDDNIDSYIGLLNNVIDVLKSTKDNKTSFTSACKDHGLDSVKVRQILLSLSKCQSNIVPLHELIVDDFDRYESFYSAVFGEKDIIKVRAKLPYDYKESVEYVLNNTGLTDRQIAVLRHRFGFTEDEECLTLEAVGKIYNVTRDRIRQIEAKALRVVRYPERCRILTKGVSVYLYEQEQKKQIRDKLIETEQQRYQQMLEKEIQKTQVDKSELRCILKDTSITELNLSIRPYNCLRRTGIKTIGETLELTTDELKTIRNLGRNSLCEIQEKCEEYLLKYNMTLADYYSTYYPNAVDNEGNSLYYKIPRRQLYGF